MPTTKDRADRFLISTAPGRIHWGRLLVVITCVLGATLSGCGRTAKLSPADLATIRGDRPELVIDMHGGFAALYMRPRSIFFRPVTGKPISFQTATIHAHRIATLVGSEMNQNQEYHVYSESTIKIVSIDPMVFTMHPRKVPNWSKKYPHPAASVGRKPPSDRVDDIILISKFSFSTEVTWSQNEVLVYSDDASILVFDLPDHIQSGSILYNFGDWQLVLKHRIDTNATTASMSHAIMGDHSENTPKHSAAPILKLTTP